MKQILTTVTERGQVTIPAEVRRVLGLKARDKVAFTIDDHQVRLTPVAFTLEEAYGSVAPSEQPEDFERLARLAKEDHAGETLRKMQRP